MLRRFIPLAVVITLLSGLSYTIAQQVLRQSANNTPLALTNDAANRLRAGAKPSSVLPAQPVDLRDDYLPYVTVLDKTGKVLASNATLNGSVPVPPAGVLTYARTHTLDKVTWEPASGVRSALVAEYVGSNPATYVIAGQSLRISEKQDNVVLDLALAGWLITEVVAFATIYITAALVPVKPLKKR